ncbi:MAG TPA: methyltransferase [Acidimicrobiales bacterium]|jgi:16S rRNA (guanine1207-N2)-methyltransferase|nr:methyltransferase [Acidimicrobiales bacterium]
MSHYFDEAPSTVSRPGRVRLELPDVELELTVDRGVFSAGGVDPGTVELLRSAAPGARAGHLLDLGCGYGPIAVTLALRNPQATVWAVDVNRRALELAAANVVAAGVAGRVRAVPPDDVPETVTFAAIWSNPPIRIGKAALHELLRSWLPRLDADAAARLVVHKHLGSDSLAAWLATEDWAVRRLGSRKGYRILEVTRP